MGDVSQLVTSRTLDRETVSEYLVTLMCRDLGRTSLSTSVQLKVIVTDINDNSPVFMSVDLDLAVDLDRAVDLDLAAADSLLVTYVAEIFENNFIGAVVTQVNTECHLANMAQYQRRRQEIIIIIVIIKR